MRLQIGKKEKWISGHITSVIVQEMKTAILQGIQVTLQGHTMHLHKGQPAKSSYVVKKVETGCYGPDAIQEITIPGVVFYSDTGETRFEAYSNVVI